MCLGIALAPLKASYLRPSNTIKVPTLRKQLFGQTDLRDLLDPTNPYSVAFYNRSSPQPLLTALLRGDLENCYATDQQQYLWLGDPPNCSTPNPTIDANNPNCLYGGATLSNLPADQDPFVAHVPTTFNSGLMRQFAPRLSTTVSYDAVQSDLLSQDCQIKEDAYYVSYNVSLPGDPTIAYSIEICMPGSSVASRWKYKRTRQDISESLYLNIATQQGPDRIPKNGAFKIQANSTAGYFELPNYHNGGQPGPLLEEDPVDLACDGMNKDLSKLSCDQNFMPQQSLIGG